VSVVALILAGISATANAATDPKVASGQPIRDIYPATAVRDRHQGTVYFTLTVAADGKVETCEITKSSGWADLDGALCTEMSRHVRFEPARDDQGDPVEGKFSSRFTFKLR
jgi:protein TonB